MWLKKGLINISFNEISWAKHSALTPTPLLLDEKIIRVYASFRDYRGVGRIGYIDLSADDPSVILNVSKYPVLDLGEIGAFDDNGMILGDIIRNGKEIWMYYVGFQLVEKVKFLAFTGLAISRDGGMTFKRWSKAPIMDRADEGIYIRAIHNVRMENGVWKIWYSVGNVWVNINHIFYPSYYIKYTESLNGINFPSEGHICIQCEHDEYRIGRGRVYVTAHGYEMYYTRGTLTGEYVSGYAISENGKNWTRRDDLVGIEKSVSGWDSKALCYPVIINCMGNKYMFYNGNDMGRYGFGYAVWVEK